MSKILAVHERQEIFRRVEVLSAKYPFVKTVQFLSRELEPMTQRAKRFFADMSLAQWRRWKPRYIALVVAAGGHQIQLKSPLRWYEREILAALMLHRGSDSAPKN